MRILGVVSQKGGSGKTTLAGHLAVAADHAGAGPVVLIDTDPQASLTEWWSAREGETPLFVRASTIRLAAGIEQIAALGIGLLVIDTPPAMTAAIEDVVRLSDLVLIPARPSPHDLRTVGATVDLVERLGKPAVFVVNGATPRARITNEAVLALSQHGTLAPVVIHHRTGFASSMIDGRTVMEIPGEERSAAEIAALWHYLDCRLNQRAAPAQMSHFLPPPARGDAASAACAA